MPAMEPLCFLLGIKPKSLSREEIILLEAELFVRICNELKEWMKQQYKNFFDLINFSRAKEDAILEKNLTQFIINDILSTDEYTMLGIACYTDTPEDVIRELASGLNSKPLAICFRKIIELHRSVRYELYQAIGKKIASEYLVANSKEKV